MSGAGVARSAAERAGPARLPHLDGLRALLVAWVIGGHALLGYSTVGGWAYHEVQEVTFTPAAQLVLLAVVGPSGLFVIGLFFFVAGLLTEEAVAVHGVRAYVRGRVVRLGVPWLVSALLVWPVSVWLAYTAAGHGVSVWWVLAHRDPPLDSGSLWFALVLLLYSVGFAAAWPRRRDPSPPRPLTGGRLAAVAGLIALSSFAVRLWFPARSGQVLDLHVWQWPPCLGLFLLGVAAARNGWHRHIPDGPYRACAAVTLATLLVLPVLAVLSGLHDLTRDAGPYLGGWHWRAMATAAVEAVLTVAGSVWLVGLAERRNLRPGRWADGAYAAFVIQGPVLMALASAVRPLAAPAEVKAPLVAVLGIAVCYRLGRWVPGPPRRQVGRRPDGPAAPP